MMTTTDRDNKYNYILDLDHSPATPVRENTPGEVIYLRLWQEYIQAEPKRLQEILVDTCYFTVWQNQARACASFMKFMGCNVGQGFTEAAIAMHAQNPQVFSPVQAFRYTWAVVNRRIAGVNGGIRIIEAMLSSKSYNHANRPSDQREVRWDMIKGVTMGDCDVIDCMVDWWASSDANDIRNKARPLIEAKRKEILNGIFIKAKTY